MLMIHAGKAVRKERSELPTDVVRPKGAGSVWRGIPHRDLAEEVVAELGRRDVEIITEGWGLMSDGASLIGSLDLVLPRLTSPTGQKYSLGIAHSNNMSRGLWITAGTHVTICDNGVITGEYILRRKHTSGINLEWEVHRGLDRGLEQFNRTAAVIDRMKSTQLTDLQVDHAFMEVGRRGVLPWSGIGKALKNYHEPPHEEFTEFKGRPWGVYQSVNQELKSKSPMVQMQSLKDLTGILAPAV